MDKRRTQTYMVQSARAAEYTDCIFAETKKPKKSKLTKKIGLLFCFYIFLLIFQSFFIWRSFKNSFNPYVFVRRYRDIDKIVFYIFDFVIVFGPLAFIVLSLGIVHARKLLWLLVNSRDLFILFFFSLNRIYIFQEGRRDESQNVASSLVQGSKKKNSNKKQK